VPMDKIKPIPVDKILNLRRIPSPQQQQTENMEYVPSFLPRQLSADTEQRPPPKGRWRPASAVELPPPLRSPMSQANRQRQLYSPNQYITILKTVVGVIGVCTLLSMFLFSRLDQNGEQENSPKILILLWNGDLARMPRRPTHTECGCVITTRRNLFNKPYDAVVFNADQPYSLEGFSEINRTANYLSVFAARNPLSLAQGPGPWATEDWPSFNLTMTYRLDSQLVWSEYYFTHIFKARRLHSFRAPNENFVDEMPGNKIQLLENHLKKKDRLAMYIIYEVDDASTPESLYLAKLRNYVDLEARESCAGPNDCSHYHFMLIFDSTACPDYVPQQVYTAMNNFVVPVLIGGGNVSHLVPPQSYISNRDFPDPKDLVAHLKRLMDATEEYQRYFWWHSLYKLRRTSLPYCQLCLHLKLPQEERNMEISPSIDFADWWSKHQCPKPFTTFL
ncbi:hypothetical protein KR032_000744, partial [Drosophila birchii]